MSSWVDHDETAAAAATVVSRHLLNNISTAVVSNFTNATMMVDGLDGGDSEGCTGGTGSSNLVIPIDESAEPNDSVLFPWFVQLLGCCS